MNRKRTLFAATTALSLAAAGLGYYASQDPSAGGQRAARLLARGCDVTIVSPAADITGVAQISAGQSLAVTLQGKALRCPAGTVSVYSSVNGAAESLLGTATVSAAGAWSYGPTTLTDNARTTLSARMSVTVDDAARPTEARVLINAATARPRVVLTTPAPAPSGRAYVVAPAADGGCGSGGNPRAEHGEPGFIHDQSCTAGGQINPSLTVYGASPGTLTVSYGVTPLASVAVTTDPQTFTAAQLGTWTLDDWTRDDLVIRAAKNGDAGVALATVDLQVSTGTPPQLMGPNGLEGAQITIVNKRGADFDVAWVLPSTPAPVARPTIEVYWTTSTRRSDPELPNVSRGVVTITSTPTLVADPPSSGRGGLLIQTLSDAGYGVSCSVDPTIPDAGSTATALPGGSASVDPNGGTINDCSGWPTPVPIYCATTDRVGTSKAVLTETGRCVELTRDWLNGSHESGGYTVPNATHIVSCWGDGTETTDAGIAVQLWRCRDGKQYRGGETYVEPIRWAPPLNTYYVIAQVHW